MKKIIGALCLLLSAQFVTGQAESKITGLARDVYYDNNKRLNFISLNESSIIRESEVAGFINSMVLENRDDRVLLQKAETDDLGFRHLRFNILHKGIKVSDKVIIAHFAMGKLVSLNGDLYKITAPTNQYSISEKEALAFALNKINAKKYKWENREEEAHMRQVLNQPDFSYSPTANKVVYEKDGKFINAYQFNIYAEEPLYRANVFVDASTGKILDEQNLICNADVPAIANTKYSGSQPITSDQNGALYRLRETGRGNGVETYNMKNLTSYSGSVDFTNTATSWTAVTADQGALDAHWGAEMTYDYYWTQHNRNSINNSGFKLISYVHYSSNYANAFWDGNRMTYGDGNGGSTSIFTTLDVCGHEISHGLNSNSAGLIYSNESGALNESYSDIFGTSIENYARPSNWNWKIGEDLTTNGWGLRSMSNPSSYGDPDTYGGSNYYNGTADNGGVHTNSGVSNFWYYLLTIGGTGTNDLGNNYAVTGVGFTKAAKIAFRALTVYYTPTTNFITARNLSIQAAKDLYGSCSPEVMATTNAWHAVGVGAAYVPGLIGADFISSTNFCSLPATVNFTNTTINGTSYTWYFGDGSSATSSSNAAHTYTAFGTYNVKLVATGCNSGVDSVIKSGYINISTVGMPVTSSVSGCFNDSVTLNATGNANIYWYNSPFTSSPVGSGTAFTTPQLTTTTMFFVSNSDLATPAYGGYASNTSGGFFNTTVPYLIFNVNQSSVLNSVVVYAIGAGNRTFQLRNQSNVVMNSISVNLSAGANTVALNFNLTPGNNYRLGLSSTSSTGLYRSTSGTAYPYNIGGMVNITSSSTGNGAYYWFYNWKVSKSVCASPKVQVNVQINPLPEVTIDSLAGIACADDHISLSGVPAGGTFSGNGVIGSTFNASLLGAGTYPVTYNYTDANNCSNNSTANFIIDACTGIGSYGMDANPVVYPNPFKDEFIIKNEAANGTTAVVNDALGREVMKLQMNSTEQKINVSHLSKGLYVLSLIEGSGKTIKTVKLIKE